MLRVVPITKHIESLTYSEPLKIQLKSKHKYSKEHLYEVARVKDWSENPAGGAGFVRWREELKRKAWPEEWGTRPKIINNE